MDNLFNVTAFGADFRLLTCMTNNLRLEELVGFL